MKLYEIVSKLKVLVNIFIPASICSDENELKDFEVKNIGLSTTATVDVIKECALNGINFLIVLDPVFYNPIDNMIPNEIGKRKKRLIEKSNLLIARVTAFNYDADFNEFKYWGLSGKWQKRTNKLVNSFVLEKSMTANEISKLIEESLKIKNIGIVGCADKPGKRISLCFSTGDIITEELFINDIIITSEINGQLIGETVRDCTCFGINKALIVIPRNASEKAGILKLGKFITDSFPETNCKYIESGELYTYL